MSVHSRLFVLAAAIAAPAVFAAAPKPDIENGKAQFAMCSICHSATKEPAPAAIGPGLFGIVGRKAASQKDFTAYSPALKDSKITWSAKTLDEFLANPMGKVPGTLMTIPVSDATNRADVIAYLATLK